MKILKNEVCRLSDFSGNIILSYLEDDKEEARRIAKWLDSKGYEYVENEISAVKVFNGSYCDKYNELLKNCSCYIFPITENFKELNRPLINVMLYQTGVLLANSEERVVLLTCKSYLNAHRNYRVKHPEIWEQKEDDTEEYKAPDPEKIIDLNDLHLRQSQTHHPPMILINFRCLNHCLSLTKIQFSMQMNNCPYTTL